MATNTIFLVVVFILIVLGIAGTILPFLPGVPLVFVSICAYGWYEGFNLISPRLIALFAGFTVLSIFLNYLSVALGAKYFGSSKYGVIGALLGIFLGIFIFPPLGIFIGPWLGATIGEYIYNKDFSSSLRSGIGAVIGLVSSIFFDLIIAITMAIWFIIKLL